MMSEYLMLCEWCLGPGIGGHSDVNHKAIAMLWGSTIRHPTPPAEKPLGGALPNDNIQEEGPTFKKKRFLSLG